MLLLLLSSLASSQAVSGGESPSEQHDFSNRFACELHSSFFDNGVARVEFDVARPQDSTSGERARAADNSGSPYTVHSVSVREDEQSIFESALGNFAAYQAEDGNPTGGLYIAWLAPTGTLRNRQLSIYPHGREPLVYLLGDSQKAHLFAGPNNLMAEGTCRVLPHNQNLMAAPPSLEHDQ